MANAFAASGTAQILLESAESVNSFRGCLEVGRFSVKSSLQIHIHQPEDSRDIFFSSSAGAAQTISKFS